jgi:hypothetical protein
MTKATLTLQFFIMLEPFREPEAVMELLSDKFAELRAAKSGSRLLRGNLIEVLRNPEADARRAMSGAGEYYYYALCLECSPMSASIDEAHQIQLARDLRDVLVAAGMQCVVGANFENKL